MDKTKTCQALTTRKGDPNSTDRVRKGGMGTCGQPVAPGKSSCARHDAMQAASADAGLVREHRAVEAQGQDHADWGYADRCPLCA